MEKRPKSTAVNSHRQLPPALMKLLRERFKPAALWLFGSRARGDFRLGSDWDIVVVVDDDNSYLADPLEEWRAASAARDMGIPTTILVTTSSDLADVWGLPNTIGYDLSREGVKLRVA